MIAIPECVIVEIGMQTHSNQQLVPNFIPCDGNSFVGVLFRGFWIFQVSREKTANLLVGITFRGIHVQYLKVTKMEAKWSFSLHSLQPISLKFSTVKKGVNYFCWIFVGGSLLSRDLIIADQ